MFISFFFKFGQIPFLRFRFSSLWAQVRAPEASISAAFQNSGAAARAAAEAETETRLGFSEQRQQA